MSRSSYFNLVLLLTVIQANNLKKIITKFVNRISKDFLLPSSGEYLTIL